MTYQRSEQHKANCENARKLAVAACAIKTQKRIKDYYLNPKPCARKACIRPVPYQKQANIYCSSSCAAITNNTGKTRTEEQKAKTSRSLSGRKRTRTTKGTGKKIISIPLEGSFEKPQFTRVSTRICTLCSRIFWVKGHGKSGRKTCSTDCAILSSIWTRTYQNGSRKPVWFYNPYEGQDVLLDSSWEVKVAEKLISHNINWTRPKFIKWIDSTNTTRRYFPDFFLPQYNIYLDPKNPYCMSKDIEKMAAVSKLIDLVYGPLETILLYIETLVQVPSSALGLPPSKGGSLLTAFT